MSHVLAIFAVDIPKVEFKAYIRVRSAGVFGSVQVIRGIMAGYGMLFLCVPTLDPFKVPVFMLPQVFFPSIVKPLMRD